MMFEHLLKPITIRGKHIRNRLAMTAMQNSCSRDGIPTDDTITYFDERARGGWGILTTDMIAVSADGGCSFLNSLSLHDDMFIDGHRRLTDAVHKHGAVMLAQLSHGGIVAKRSITGVKPMSPSPVKDQTMAESARALTVPEIERLVEQFGDAALRAKKAGYDGVEIHGGNRYLIFSFVSPLINKRTDCYGGNIVRRAKFPVDIVRNVRAKTGDDFLIVYKMSTKDYVIGGQELAESELLARMLEDAGVDIISCGQGGCKTRQMWIPSYNISQGRFIENTEAIRRAVDIPVMANGRIVNPELGDLFLREGRCDFIAMGREALADPEMPRKINEGRVEEVFRCIGCHQGCLGELDKLHKIRCLLNPEVNCGMNPALRPERIKTVWVIGGGVAGCEAAVRAASRGHRVTLFEKDDALGGQWRAACVPVSKSDFAEVIHRHEVLLKKYGVDVHLNHEVTAEEILSARPDAVIAAVGSEPAVPSIEGLESSGAVTARDVLLGKVEIINNTQEKTDRVVHAVTTAGGGRIVVIGGGLVGLETAEHLALHGNRVIVLEMLPDLAEDAEGIPRKYLLENLERLHVTCLSSAHVQKAAPGRVWYVRDGQIHEIDDISMIILAAGVKPSRKLPESLGNYDGELLLAGDALEAGNGYKAIQSGFVAGATI